VGALVVTVRSPDGSHLAEVTVIGGRVRIDPPEAGAHPLVAAVAAQMERTAARPQSRPSC
jgi:hypothetical protein